MTQLQLGQLKASTPLFLTYTTTHEHRHGAAGQHHSPVNALYSLITALRMRLTAVDALSGLPISTLSTTLTSYATRLNAAQSLSGVSTTLTSIVIALRDVSSSAAHRAARQHELTH